MSRPFVALNPEADKRHELADISRIAIAIKRLNILQAPETPALTKKHQAPQTIKAARRVHAAFNGPLTAFGKPGELFHNSSLASIPLLRSKSLDASTARAVSSPKR